MDEKVNENSLIKPSHFTEALVTNFKLIKKKPSVDEHSKIDISRTVSFFAILYEKIRNAVEYREEHLIRRAAIERILKRRLLLNPQGKGEAENLLRELLWARYFPSDSLDARDIDSAQTIIDSFLQIRRRLLVGQEKDKRLYYDQFLLDLATCSIEETLAPQDAKKISLFVFYIFQVLKNKIKIEKMSEDQKDALLYVAIEKTFAKSDRSYLRYHLSILSHPQLHLRNYQEIELLIPKLPSIFDRIERIINHQGVDKLIRYIKSQMPPFLILYSLFNRNKDTVGQILTNNDQLWARVDEICREKYQQTSSRLQSLAIKSLIYIFLTKMIFALLLEVPLSDYFYGEVNYFAIAINSLFPPLLMLFIIGLVRTPGEENTRRLFERIKDIIDVNKSFETTLSYIGKEQKVKKPVLIFGFTVFYTLTFMVTLTLIYEILTLLQFNLISQSIFIFFVSLVSFFGYRVSQISREYKLQERESFFAPFIDFFFMPILSLGKFFSSEIAKLKARKEEIA
ncbi:hypothetical protein HYW87_01285 [Candidatus Roizmanbacteria bacterium]|nr:hypothetical protein [Candidatus Roizmanbacteria bacterium]